MTDKEILEIEIEEKKEEIKEKQQEIDSFEIDQDDKEDEFCEMLDESYEHLFNMLPSQIMLECDPIMYNTELGYYVDSLDITDEEDYKELEEELKTLESELEDLEEQLEELEND